METVVAVSGAGAFGAGTFAVVIFKESLCSMFLLTSAYDLHAACSSSLSMSHRPPFNKSVVF